MDEIYDTAARLPGSNVEEILVYVGLEWGVMGWIGRAAVLLLANGIIKTAKQLPEVSITAVCGRAAICLAGISCDWWGGNIEKLIR